MHLDSKTFNDSSESGLAIQKVTARAGLSHGASLDIFYQVQNKDAILRSLNDAGVRVRSSGSSSLTIQADGLFQCERIKVALNTLKSANFISESFVRQISEGFPNGHGGIHPLNSNIFSSRTTLESRVRNYVPRPIDHLGAATVDHSSLIEETHPISTSSGPRLSSSGVNLMAFLLAAQTMQPDMSNPLIFAQLMELNGLTSNASNTQQHDMAASLAADSNAKIVQDRIPTLGPYAIKTAEGDYAWIRLIVDEKANLLGYEEATDFKNNHWSDIRQADHLPAKFSVYDPSPDTGLHQFCVALKNDGEKYHLVRFPFRKDNKSGNYLPLPNGEKFKTISSGSSNDGILTQGWALDFNEKAKMKGITSDDYWQPEQRELETLTQTYNTWHISIEPKWHQGLACTELDLKKDDAGNNKLALESNLTPFQRAQVEGMLFIDWNLVKTASKSSEEYCKALSLIMTGSLNDNIMNELKFSTEMQANAPGLRHYLLTSTIDKFGSRFYEGDNRSANEKSTIADVHQYMVNLMQQEINQYDPSLKVHVNTQIPKVQIGKLSTNTSVGNATQPFRNEMERRRGMFDFMDFGLGHLGLFTMRGDVRARVQALATQDEIQVAINAGNGLFTAADIAGIRHGVGYALSQPACIAAIREGLFTASVIARCNGSQS